MDNPAMSRFEMSLGDGALAVAYYKVEDGPVVLLHAEVPQELSGPGHGSRLAHSVLEALRRDNGDREVPLQAFPRFPARVRRGPRWLTADRRGARAQRF